MSPLRLIVLFLALLASPTVADDLGCTICKKLLGGLGPLLTANTTKAVIEPIAVLVCEQIEKGKECTGSDACADLCKGVIREHIDIVLQIAADTVLAPAELCYILKACPAPPPPLPPFSDHVVVPSDCSDHSGEKNWPSWSLTSGSGYFIQLSDIHMDLLYQAGTNSQCGEPLCCRAVNGPGTSGVWGDYNCDIPPTLVESLFQHIASLQPPPDFILYTGDDPAHDIWEQSQDSNLKSINALSNLMAKYFPNIPLFPAMGNHEIYPVNQYEGPSYDSWLFLPVAADWATWVPEPSLNTVRYGGYYTARVRPGLRVVSINTNYYPDGDFWLKRNHSDYSSQIAWLKDVLHQAQTLQEKVIVIGHQVPQGWYSDFSNIVNQILVNYSSIIVGQFFGHSHSSKLMLYYDNSTYTGTDKDVPVSVAYVGGSLTTYTNLNPGYTVYTYDRSLSSRWLVDDYSVYWIDLNATNTQGGPPDWTIKRYSAKAEYGLPDTSPQSWAHFASSMISNSTLFSKYVNNYYRGGPGPHNDSPVDMACEIMSSTPETSGTCNRVRSAKH